MGLEGIELWSLPVHSVAPAEPIFARFATPQLSPSVNSELACCRAMLAPRLCESAARTHELAWYGVSPEQKVALARTGISLRTIVGVPCLEPPSDACIGLMGMRAPICGVLVLYTRRELPQTEAFGMLLHAIGSASAAAYALGLSIAKTAPLAHPHSYTSMPAESPTASLTWLMLAAARTLQIDIAEHWTARQLPPARGGAVYMTAEQILVSDRARALPQLVLATGASAEAHHPFSSHMSRASLYAGKLVWCNGPSPCGLLEGIKVPMQTAIGLPLRSHMGGGATFVFYCLQRLEQSPSVTLFLAQLQVLAAASHVAGSQGALDRAAGPIDADASGPTVIDSTSTNPPAPNPPNALRSVPHDPRSASDDAHAISHSDDCGLAAAPCAALAVAREASGSQSVHESGTGDGLWRSPERSQAQLQQEAVMSTDQVISLIECLGDPSSEPSRGMSRAVSMTALAALEMPSALDDVLTAPPSAAELAGISDPLALPPPVPMRHAGCSDDLSAIRL